MAKWDLHVCASEWNFIHGAGWNLRGGVVPLLWYFWASSQSHYIREDIGLDGSLV